MTPHRRRLPHVYPEGAALFLTWHLHGSLPASLLPPPRSLASGQAFVWLDRQLDALRRGPRYLHRPDIAQIVVNSIRKGVELGHYELGAYVVMPNHVHLLIQPSIAPECLMKTSQGSQCPRGQPCVRTNRGTVLAKRILRFQKIRMYIEANPVKAGLVRSPQDYPWSSAGVETSLDAARRSACATLS